MPPAPISEVADAGLGKGDCLIALSASGSTPYAVGALKEAIRRGARTIAIANNAGSPLLELAEAPILLATPPEIIAGSTRMGAGTAQKIALNMLSTLAAIHLGHVHDGYMVNLHADNMKLRGARGAHRRRDRRLRPGGRRLKRSKRRGGQVKPAVLLAAGAGRREDCARTARRDRPKTSPGAVEMSSEGSRPKGCKPSRLHDKRT